MNAELFERQLFVKLVSAMENVAYQLREGESREAIAEALENAAKELRDDLHRGQIH